MFPGAGELGYSPGEHREDLRRASGGIERSDRYIVQSLRIRCLMAQWSSAAREALCKLVGLWSACKGSQYRRIGVGSPRSTSNRFSYARLSVVLLQLRPGLTSRFAPRISPFPSEKSAGLAQIKQR